MSENKIIPESVFRQKLAARDNDPTIKAEREKRKVLTLEAKNLSTTILETATESGDELFQDLDPSWQKFFHAVLGRVVTRPITLEDSSVATASIKANNPDLKKANLSIHLSTEPEYLVITQETARIAFDIDENRIIGRLAKSSEIALYLSAAKKVSDIIKGELVRN